MFESCQIEAVLDVYGYECVFAHLCLLRSEKMIDGYVYLYETFCSLSEQIGRGVASSKLYLLSVSGSAVQLNPCDENKSAKVREQEDER